MGLCQTKLPEPNNPFEIEKYKREMYERKYREREKQTKKRKNSEERLRQRAHRTENTNETQNSGKQRSDKKFKESDYDLEARNRMQDQLANDSQAFVLNQLMLAIQFHGNFEK